MKTTQQFLAQEVYLPGFMLLTSEDYEENRGCFDFFPREPKVARGDIVHYVTPRSLHICISQATYCFIEEQSREGKLDFDIPTLRQYLLRSRVKITELNQRFRKEVPLAERLQGTFTLNRFRFGRLPMAKFDFDFGNRAVKGNMIAVVAPHPTPQINAGTIRI